MGTNAAIETDALRRIIERRQIAHLWGQPQWITPRLVTKVFGDGMKLMNLYPINFRPNHFVVRVDSHTNYADLDYEVWLDPIYTSIEEEFYEWPWAAEYGFTWHEDEGADCDSRLNFAGGASWGFCEIPRQFFREVESTRMLRGLWREFREPTVCSGAELDEKPEPAREDTR